MEQPTSISEMDKRECYRLKDKEQFGKSKEEEIEKQKSIVANIEALENNQSFKFLMQVLLDEINNAYNKLVNGNKEEFDYGKGRLVGLNYLLVYIKTQKEKLKSLTKLNK